MTRETRPARQTPPTSTASTKVNERPRRNLSSLPRKAYLEQFGRIQLETLQRHPPYFLTNLAQAARGPFRDHGEDTHQKDTPNGDQIIFVLVKFFWVSYVASMLAWRARRRLKENATAATAKRNMRCPTAGWEQGIRCRVGWRKNFPVGLFKKPLQ